MVGLFGTSVIALLALLFGAFMSIAYYRLERLYENRGKAVDGLKSTLKTTQRMKTEAITRGIAAATDLERVRNRAKYFVDLLNVLANEPFSRRKREAFFADVRRSGIDGALISYEQEYGNLIDRELLRSIRASAVAIHQDVAEEVREQRFEENRAIFEVARWPS